MQACIQIASTIVYVALGLCIYIGTELSVHPVVNADDQKLAALRVRDAPTTAVQVPQTPKYNNYTCICLSTNGVGNFPPNTTRWAPHGTQMVYVHTGHIWATRQDTAGKRTRDADGNSTGY